MTPDGKVLDVGIQTSEALRALQDGIAAHLSGPRRENANGNGALMRCLPIAFFARNKDVLVDQSMRQGLVTHGHTRSQLCCALYALLAANILEYHDYEEGLARTENELLTASREIVMDDT